MSVPEGKRTKSKFEVIVKARNIVVHTIKITSNEKSFPEAVSVELHREISR